MSAAKCSINFKDPQTGLLVSIGGESLAEVEVQLRWLFGNDSTEADSVLLRVMDTINPPAVQAEPITTQRAVATVQANLPVQVIDPEPQQGRGRFRAQQPAQPQQTATPPALSAVVCKHNEPAKLLAAGVYKSGERQGQPRPAVYVCNRPKVESCGLWQDA